MTESLLPSTSPATQRLPASSAAWRWAVLVAVLLAAVGGAAAWLAWGTQQRVKELEQQLVKRQEDSGAMASAAQMLAKQAQDTANDAAAKMALLEARVAEATMQRSQLEELIQSLSRARDENVLADIEAAIRVALQQTAITGSAEPLIIALKQSEERLARQHEPRLEGVRRAIVQDQERVRGAGAVDLATLAIRLDEAVRQVDELPLLSAPERRGSARPAARAASSAALAVAVPPAASAPMPQARASWSETLSKGWAAVSSRVWDEVRGLVRVTEVEHPEAMLIAPEQAYFLRENLKLRLLNARLALLSRQFDTAQSDLRDALSVLERYFDRSSKRVTATTDLLRQVSVQARQVVVPRPDATLTAIAAVSGAR